MSQDRIADALNQIMNAKRAGKDAIKISHHSKFLLTLLALAKLKGYVKSYQVKDNVLTIEIGNIHGCKAIKPRYAIAVQDIEKYVARYLPAKDIGVLILSTSNGLITHKTAQEKNIGGCLIAYMY